MNLNRENFIKTVLFVIALLTISLCLVKGTYILLSYFNIIIPWWCESPSVLSTMAFIYLLFDNYFWSKKFFKTIKLIEMPDLNGRWKGVIVSSYHEHQRETPAVLEVYQTSSKIFISMYLEHSESNSLVAGFVKKEDGRIELHYEYQNVPKMNAIETMKIHFGTAQFKYYADTDSLEGSYYSSVRDRESFGSMKFARESRLLRKKW